MEGPGVCRCDERDGPPRASQGSLLPSVCVRVPKEPPEEKGEEEAQRHHPVQRRRHPARRPVEVERHPAVAQQPAQEDQQDAARPEHPRPAAGSHHPPRRARLDARGEPTAEVRRWRRPREPGADREGARRVHAHQHKPTPRTARRVVGAVHAQEPPRRRAPRLPGRRQS